MQALVLQFCYYFFIIMQSKGKGMKRLVGAIDDESFQKAKFAVEVRIAILKCKSLQLTLHDFYTDAYMSKEFYNWLYYIYVYYNIAITCVAGYNKPYIYIV